MKEGKHSITTSYGVLFMITAFYIVSVLLSMYFGRMEGYRQGQVDAINGKIKYKKIENTEVKTTYEKQ